MESDTIIHEYAHLLIEGLGGLNSPLISEAVEQLKGSNLWEEVKKAYPELQSNELAMEVLATAVGREGARIFAKEEASKKSRWMRWLDRFFAKVKEIFGINRSKAVELANILLSESNVLQAQEIEIDGIQFQRSLSEVTLESQANTIEEVIDRVRRNLVGKIQSRQRYVTADTRNTKLEDLSPEDQKKISNINALTDLEQSLADDLEKSAKLRAAMRFVIHAQKATKGIASVLSDKIKADDLSVEELKNISDYADTYEVIDEFAQAMDIMDLDADPAFTKDLQDKIRGYLAQIGENRRRIESMKDAVLPTVLARRNVKNSHRVRTSKRRQFEREYDKSNGQKRSERMTDSYKEARAKEVNKRMAEQMDSIMEEEMRVLEDSIKNAKHDINVLQALMMDPRGISDAMISTAVKELDRADFRSMTKFLDYMKDFTPKYMKYVASRGTSGMVNTDVAELNNMFITETKNGNMRLITEKELGKLNATEQDKEYYYMIAEMLNTADALLPVKFKSSYKDKLFLPAVRKGKMERLSQDGLMPLIKEMWADSWQLQQGDVEDIGIGAPQHRVIKEEYVDENGKPQTRDVIQEAPVTEANPLSKTPSQLEIEQKVQEMVDNKSYIKGIDKDGKVVELDSGVEYTHYYNTKTNDKYTRTTSYIDDAIFPESRNKGESMEDYRARMTEMFTNDPDIAEGDVEGRVNQAMLLASSQVIGTAIDEFTRDFFANELKDLSEYTFADREVIEGYKKQLEETKAKIEEQGITIVANDVVLYDETSKTAGTVDLLAYNKKGEFFIYDMKSMRGNFFEDTYRNETQQTNDPRKRGKDTTYMNKYYSRIYGSGYATKHAKQLSMYRIMMNNTHGVRAKQLAIIPIQIGYKPGDTKTSVVNKLPSVGHEPINNLKDAQLKRFKSEAVDSITYSNEDYDRRFEASQNKFKEEIVEVFANEKNQEQHFVPIYFRGNVAKEDQSKDLFGIAMSNLYMALNYSNKISVAPNIEMLKDAVANRDVDQRDSKNRLKVVKNIFNKLAGGTESSNIERAFNSMVESRLYGINQIDAGEFMGVNKNAAMKQLMGITGGAALMLNYSATAVNEIQGHVATYINSVGGLYYSPKHVNSAQVEYIKSLGGIIADIGKPNGRATSKINLAIEKFNMMGEFNGFINDMMQDTKVKQLFTTGSLHGMSGLAEHHIQSVLMMAAMKAIKVYDIKGNPIVENGKDMNMWDAYSVETKDDSARLVMDPRVAKTSRNMNASDWVVDKDGVSEGEFETAIYLRYLNANLNGNYDPANLALAQRYVIGQAAFMLKKWMPRGAALRFKGFDVSNELFNERLDRGEILDEREYSEALQDREVGRYTVAKNFFMTMFKRFKTEKLKAISSTWEDMDEMEFAHMQKNIVGMLTTISMFAASSLLAGMADEEEDANTLWFWAYVLKKSQQEMTFWVNPSDFLRTVGTPIASFRTLSQIFSIFEDLMPWTDNKYKSGANEGEYKAWVKFTKVVPYLNMLNQFDRDYEKSYNFLLNGPVR
jgi:hypothetical protein